MEVKVSSKYQIVIPKVVRRQLGIKPGEKMDITTVGKDQVLLTKPMDASSYIKHYAGSLTDSSWQKEGVDASVWLRRQRDNDRP